MTMQQGGIDFDHVGIGTALSRNRFEVPLNQREYSWENEHVLALFQDLANAIDNSKSSYFLGTIVLTPGRDGVLEVADGQQRLATTTILLGAIRDYFVGRNEEALAASLETFLITFVRETHSNESRLSLNVDDNEYFRKRILARESTVDRNSATVSKPSHQRIENAAQLAKAHIQNIISPHNESNRNDRLNLWVRFIEESAQVISLTVPDDLNAFVMFETLNDRGVRTTQADLVKNYLFSQADDRIDEAQQKWATMNGVLDTLDQDDLTLTYLRHLMISLDGHLTEKEVLVKIKEKAPGKQPAIEFVDILAENAANYVAMLTPTHAKWNGYSTSIREHIKTLGFLQVTPMRPLMLAVANKFPKKQAEKSFRQFVFWSVRYLIAGGLRSGTVEQGIATAAKNVSDGTIKTAVKLATEMSKILPTDRRFESAFANARVQKHALARYYLRSLERKVLGDPEPELVPNEEIVINLEHVLPENPEHNWPNFDASLHPIYYNRLGNMVLLKGTVNSEIGNNNFAEKRKKLKDSAYRLTKEVASKTVWNPQEIDRRQSDLAKHAVLLWPLKAS